MATNGARVAVRTRCGVAVDDVANGVSVVCDDDSEVASGDGVWGATVSPGPTG